MIGAQVRVAVWAGAVAAGFAAYAARPAPGDDAAVARVRDLGPQFTENSVGVTGCDGATSLVLPDGRSLWVFGDTVEGPFQSIRELDLAPLRSNTGAVVPKQDAAHGIREFHFLATDDGRRPRQLILFAPEEDPATTRLWPIHGTCAGRRVYLFYHRISLLEGVDVFENFRLEGMGLARSEWAPDGGLTFDRRTAADGTREFWKGDQPTFGVWVERDGDMAYLWGSLLTGMFLARVPVERIEDLSAYEYLIAAATAAAPNAAPRWSQQFQPTAVLFDSVPNETSVSFNERLGAFLAIHALGRDGQIVMRTAPARTGPWSLPRVIYQVARSNDSELVYAAKEHPELAADGGRRIYITYVNSGTYLPRMLEVTLR
ncbi:MAG: hypothetical protein DCC67_01735 [Planctomycetota bacterium]|nr:MAG: hypothetical protein DCC67_01735 [Planctomycetota bacterium]